MITRRSSEWLLPALLLTVLSAPVAGQGTDGRWLPFLGCWEATPATAENPMLCIVTRGTDAAVDMVAIANGQVVSRSAVRADAQMLEGTREGCTGWDRARFSSDGTRVYLDAEHLCGTVRQQSSGMLAMVSGTEWVDVRSVSVEGQPATGVVHYTLAPIDVAEAAGFGNIAADQAMAVRAARAAASAAVTVDDVVDASEFVSDDVVRTWVAERKQPLQLNSERVVRMADAGVSPEVIDVVIAVSYPRYFTVGAGAQVAENERQGYSDLGAVGGYSGYGRRYGGFYDPLYGSYGSYYGSYYGGYYGGGYYDYFGPNIYRPTVVVIERGGEQQQRPGRAVNGRGYTRSAGSTSTGSSSNGGSSSEPAPAPASSSGEGGGGSSSTGRTAKPREP